MLVNGDIVKLSIPLLALFHTHSHTQQDKETHALTGVQLSIMLLNLKGWKEKGKKKRLVRLMMVFVLLLLSNPLINRAITEAF